MGRGCERALATKSCFQFFMVKLTSYFWRQNTLAHTNLFSISICFSVIFVSFGEKKKRVKHRKEENR